MFHVFYVLALSVVLIRSFFFDSVFDAKRLIGRKFDDPEVQSDIKHFPFTVFNKGGKPYIRVEYRGEQKEFVSLHALSLQ
jgi:molecular chaperone DnaK (HSP70)